MRPVGKPRQWLALTILIISGPLSAGLFADADNPPARVARLSYLKGSVSLQPSGANDWSQATLNYPLTTGDRLYTDQGSQAELEVGSIAIRASDATDLTVANLDDQVMQLGLGSGTIRLRLFALRPGDSIEVDTPNGALSLLRAGSYRVETYPNDNATLVIVNQGSLEVSGGNLQQEVGGGQAVKLTGSDPIVVSFVAVPSPDGFDQWCQERDRRFESSASARYVGREVPGYYDLDDYGRWREEREYGPVWYPTAVPAGWVPYRYGHWVWIEPWGWTWVEDEPWGYCPFHYGRWVFVGNRWGWMPGPVVVRPYFAPALVAFVGGPNFTVAVSVGRPVGWFPLGPREPYYPWYHHGGTYLREVNVTNIRNVTNITNITNVTNINNIRYVNRTAATTVVSSETFRSGQPVSRQTVRVDPSQLAQARIVPHPRFSPSSNALIGGRPAPNPPRVARPVMTPAAGRVAMPGGATPPPVTTRTAPAATNVPARPPQTSQAPVFTRPAPPATPAPAGPPSRPAPVITRTPPPNAPRAVGPASAPPRTSPPLVTRRPAPTAVPLPEREKAMEGHPGRPLEPQQLRNLQAGKPAGPMRDREFPPHPPQVQASAPKGRGSEKAERPPKQERSRRDRP